MSRSPLRRHATTSLTNEDQNDASYDAISSAVGIGRNGRDGVHPAIKPRPRSFENEPYILVGICFKPRPKRGDNPRIFTLHHRRLDLCISVFSVLYQHRNLYVVVRIYPRAYPWPFFVGLRHSSAAVHTSSNGVRTSWRDEPAPA